MNKVKIGVVGTGARAMGHGSVLFTEELAKQLDVTALCDVNPDKLSIAAKYYEERGYRKFKTYSDFRTMFAKDRFDGIFVAAPNYLHRDITVAALEAGFNVLCEKPMDVTLARCDEMIAAARRTGKILAMGMQMYYRVRYHKVRELIEAGRIGKVAQVWCTEYREPYAETKDWVWEMAKSGGAIVEKNCHHYNIMDMWAQSKPTTVYASGNIKKHFQMSGKKSEIVDNAWIISDYENGARAMLGVNFLAEGSGHHREFGVIGTRGRIFFSGEDNEIIHLDRGDNSSEDFKLSSEPDLRGGVMQDFIDCIRTGRQPLVTPELGRESLLVPLAAEKSIREKRIVHVNELA